MISFHCTEVISYHFTVWIVQSNILEPCFNEPLFKEVLDRTNDILRPAKVTVNGKTNIIRKPKCKIYLDITNYNVNTRQKIDAAQISSQQIPYSL